MAAALGLFAYLLVYLQYIRDKLIGTWYTIAGRALPVLAAEDTDLTGKVAIVTGANSGIGFSLAQTFARQNATVYLACRNVQKGQEAASQIIDSLTNGSGSSKRIHVVQLDTSSLKSVRAFVDAWNEGGRASANSTRKIDILVHNAGISGSPSGSEEITDEGLDLLYATNFLGSYLMTALLEKNLTSDARVVMTSSVGQYNAELIQLFTNPRLVPVDGNVRQFSKIYADTKSMQVVFAKLLQERWLARAAKDGNTRIAHSFSPGFSATPILNKITDLARTDPVWTMLNATQGFAVPADTGAATGHWLATSKDAKVATPAKGGKYWDRLTEFTPSAAVFEAKYGHGALLRLWDLWTIDSGAEWA